MANILTLRHPIQVGFKKSSGGVQMTLQADTPYLIAESQLNRLLKDQQVVDACYKISRVDTRIKNFHVDAFHSGSKILLCNASGGFGDILMTLPVIKILHDRYKFQMHVLTDPGNTVGYWSLPWIKTVSTFPIAWETVLLFDAFAFFEAVVNMDEHQDQLHPVDAMLHKIGIDPAAIPDEEKRIRLKFNPQELGTLVTFLQPGRRLGLYQLSSANPVRGLPANDSVFLILKVAENQPNIHWLCLYDEFVPKEYREMLEAKIAEQKLTNIEPFCAPNLRELWALTEHASVVVSPDSMMCHVAGVLDTPCVGLWGPMSPESRVKYYKNHFPIFHRDVCPHSPCFVYSAVFPRYCPSRPAARTVCDVLASISWKEVADAVAQFSR